MNSTIKVFIILLGLILICSIMYLLVKRRINDRHSLFWFIGAFIILILSLFPEILEMLANMVGIDYPPSLLFLFAILVILAIVLYQSMQISVLQERLRELTQQMAIEHYLYNPAYQEQKEVDCKDAGDSGHYKRHN